MIRELLPVCFAYGLIFTALGYWLGWRAAAWYIAKLRNRIAELKVMLHGAEPILEPWRQDGYKLDRMAYEKGGE